MGSAKYQTRLCVLRAKSLASAVRAVRSLDGSHGPFFHTLAHFDAPETPRWRAGQRLGDGVEVRQPLHGLRGVIRTTEGKQLPTDLQDNFKNDSLYG